MSVDNESDKNPHVDLTQRNDEKGSADEGDERAFADASIKMNERTIIRAEKDGYWADYEFDPLWSADGSLFTLRSSRYRAKDNGRTSGNLHAKIIGLSEPSWTELNNDNAVQDGVWRGAATVITTRSFKPDHSVTVGFYYIYDRNNVPDVHMYGYKDFPFLPQVPIIDPVQNVLEKTFRLSGRNGVYQAGTINIYQDSNNAHLAGPVNPGHNGDWFANYTFYLSYTSIGVYAIQKIAGKNSAKSAPIERIYYAGVSTPSAGSVLLSQAEFSGFAAPHTRVKILKNDGAEVSDYSDVDASAQWKLKLEAGLSSGKYSLGVWLRWPRGETVGKFTRYIDYDLLGVPVITGPAAASSQSIPFIVTGNNGLGGATIKVYRSDTDSEVGSGTLGATGSWTVTVDRELPFGRVSLVVEQEKGSKKSGRSVLREFIIPPNKPTLQADINNEIVRLYGTGLTGARLDIHFADDPTVYLYTDVTAGGWEKDIPADLVPASYSFSVRQSVPDESDRIYSAYSSNLSVEVPVPRPIEIQPSLDGQTPTYSGKGRTWTGVNSYVLIYNDQVQMSVFPDALVQTTDGTWRTTANETFAPGRYQNLSARLYVNSKYSDYAPIGELTIPSPRPVFSQPLESPEYTSQRPTFEGAVWPGSQVRLTIEGLPEIPLSAASGTFTHTVTDDWPPGPYTVEAVATFGGQPSETERNFVIRTPKPVITTSGAVDLAPTIEGTGWPGGWVVIHKGDGSELGSGPVDTETEKFSVPLGLQSQGPLIVYATQALAHGSSNISEETARVQLTVGVRAPVILIPEAGSKTTRTSTFSGTGMTGGTVEFYLGGASEPFEHGIRVEESQWEATLELPAGNPQLEVALRYSGVPSPKLLHPIKVVPAPPIIDTPRPDEALGDVLYISGFGFPDDEIRIYRHRRQEWLGNTTVTQAGTWTTRVPNQLDAAGDKIVVLASAGEELDSDESDQLQPTLLLTDLPEFTEPLANERVGLRPMYAGIAEPNATVWVASWFNSDDLVAPSTVADQFGRWQVMGDVNLPELPTRVCVSQTVDGVHSQWVESGRFIVEKMLAGFERPIVDFPQEGQEVGRFPMFSGRGVPGAKMFIIQSGNAEVHLVNDCWVDRNGRWAARSVIELPLGPYSYSTKQQRDGADSSWVSPNRTIKVIEMQAGFPAAVIDTPTQGASVERRPLFAGTGGTPGAMLNVFSRAEEDTFDSYGVAQVDAQGNWSTRSAVQLDVRQHLISCIQALDGQESLKPSTVTFTVTDVINTPVIVSPATGGYVSPRAVIRGTALPGARVFIVTSGDASEIWASGLVDEQGQWVVVTRPLPIGDFDLATKAEKDGKSSGWRGFHLTVLDQD